MSEKKTKKIITASTSSKSRPGAKPVYKGNTQVSEPIQFVFSRKNFIFLGIGILLMVIGFILMSGGKMPSPDVWDNSLIYSKRIVVLSPIFILSGLGVIAYSIFKK
ncbi:MAG: DUF3098 domain-containing protein [Deltaproteobacteria bacterium]